MTVGHLVPAYLAVVWSQPYWKPEWSSRRRVALWVAALVTPVVPDLDVIYNILFHGFSGHRMSWIWTHSLFPNLGLVLAWWLIRRNGCRPYLQVVTGLVAVGGLSHVVLDIASHSTPMFYPFSMYMVGVPPPYELEGTEYAYVEDLVILLEVLLVALAVGHWVVQRRRRRARLEKSLEPTAYRAVGWEDRPNSPC